VTFVLGVLVTVLVYVFAFQRSSERSDGLELLGVESEYSRVALPAAKIDAYLELKEKLRGQYAKSSEADEVWMSQLPIQAKELLKYRLMQRAIGGMAALQRIDADARGYWRLFCKGAITKQYWNSVVQAEQEISHELDKVKAEAAAVEPTQDPRRLIQEAMQFLTRYGDRLPSAEDIASSADAFADVLKHLPGPGALPGLAGMPPGALPGLGLPPGALPPGALPPAPPPCRPPGAALPQPAPQDAAASDTYKWKQDTDEVEVSVGVPDTAVKGEVKVVIQPRCLRVLHRDQALIEGQLSSFCNPEGSTWTLGRGQVTVSLEKKDPRPWPALFAPAPS
jgi:hypothetical protein